MEKRIGEEINLLLHHSLVTSKLLLSTVDCGRGEGSRGLALPGLLEQVEEKGERRKRKGRGKGK